MAISLNFKLSSEIIKKEIGKDIKILIMLRDPIEMMHSLHTQRLASGTEDVKNFEKALKIDKIKTMGAGEYMIVPYKEIADYSKHLDKWFKIFGREKVKVIIFEEFLSDPGKIFKEVLNFLRVDNNFKPRFEVINPSNIVKSMTLRNMIRDVIMLPKPAQKLIKILIPLRVRNMIRRANEKEIKRELLRKEIRKKLLKEQEPKIEKLEKILNKNLNYWKTI